jgi:hypothetical protein
MRRAVRGAIRPLAAKWDPYDRPIGFRGRANGRTIYSVSGRVTTALRGDPL